MQLEENLGKTINSSSYSIATNVTIGTPSSAYNEEKDGATMKNRHLASSQLTIEEVEVAVSEGTQLWPEVLSYFRNVNKTVIRF